VVAYCKQSGGRYW